MASIYPTGNAVFFAIVGAVLCSVTSGNRAEIIVLRDCAIIIRKGGGGGAEKLELPYLFD